LELGAPLLKLEEVSECVVLKRVTRFSVLVERGGSAVAYLANTGRLEGLLEAGRLGYCVPSKGAKTSLRLVAISVGSKRGAALVDTALQAKAFERAVELGFVAELAECKVASRNPRVGSSVLDYVLGCPAGPLYVELKSAVLLEPDGAASYPDCLSLRGRRHVEELAKLAAAGIGAALVFVAGLPEAKLFRPNARADPLMPVLLKRAAAAGVRLLALSVYFDPSDSAVKLGSPSLRVEL